MNIPSVNLSNTFDFNKSAVEDLTNYGRVQFLFMNTSNGGNNNKMISNYINNNSIISFDGGGTPSNMSSHHYPLELLMSAVAATAAPAVNTGSSDVVQTVVVFSNLYPAVFQCFVIILCGYVAGRSNLISQTEAKGLNTFVTYFSLPALIFMSLAKLDFSSVNWLFLMAICLAKSVVFALVAIITVLVHQPSDYAKAGLYAIFCTQSNDFALGYPIVEALYSTTHPEFPSYLYLLAPISLVLLNPIGFILMEIGKSMHPSQHEMSANISSSNNTHIRGTTHSSRRTYSLSSTTSSEHSNIIGNNVNGTLPSGDFDSSSIISHASTSSSSSSSDNKCSQAAKNRFGFTCRILKAILLNPVVAMTLLGILGNVIFKHQLPSLLHSVLEVLGQAFSASALFALGVRMVGKVAALRGASLVLPGILITVKTIMLPLVCREFVSLLKPGGEQSNATEDYSNYGFLYGTFPTAPSVFVFANHYNVQPDLVASAMVAVTFLSAPLMLVSAKMVALVHIDPLDYVNELESFMFNISILGLIAAVWVVFVFLLSRKWQKVPHCITLCLAVSQAMASMGALLWSVIDCTATWQLYLQFILVTWGVFATRFFTALLAATLFLLRWRSLAFVLKMRPVLALIGWCIPGLLVLALVLAVEREMEHSQKQDPNFQYGTTQAVVALLLLWFTLFTTVVCLILQQRQRKRHDTYSPVADAHSSDDLRPLNSSRRDDGGLEHRLPPSDGSNDDNVSTDSADSLFSPNDDLRPNGSPPCPDHRNLTRALDDEWHGSGDSSVPVQKSEDINLSQEPYQSVTGAAPVKRQKMATLVQISEDSGDVGAVPQTNAEETGAQDAGEDVCARQRKHVLTNAKDSNAEDGADPGRPRWHGNQSCSRQRRSRSTALTLPLEDNILRDRDDEFQMLRHVVLLLFLCGSMIVGFGLCLWTLVSEEVSGVYVEMVFLDSVLNYGQGIFTAVIFGLDTKLIVLPLLRCYRRVVHGATTLPLPPLHAIPQDYRQTCEQFTRYHMDKCCRDIVRDRRWRLNSLRSVFTGQELVDWLLMVGLANDRTHAARYGRALLAGRVIRHIDDLHHFHDQTLFYTFCYQHRKMDLGDVPVTP